MLTFNVVTPSGLHHGGDLKPGAPSEERVKSVFRGLPLGLPGMLYAFLSTPNDEDGASAKTFWTKCAVCSGERLQFKD